MATFSGGAMFDRLRSAITTLEHCARELQVECLEGADAAQLVDVIGRGERVCSAMKALLARRVAETGVWRDDGSRNAAVWLSAQTGTTVGAAQQVFDTARALEELPATEAAFRSGEISAVQAAEIASAAVEAPAAERALLDAARSTSVKGLRDRAREVRAGAQEDDAAWARRQHDRRYGRVWTDPEGSLRIEGSLPPETGARFKAVFDAEVDRIFREARRSGRRETLGAYGADALVAMADGGPRKPVSTTLVVDAAPIDRGHALDGERCAIEGIGPIPVATARRLLQDASISLLVRDGDELTAVGRPVRTIPANLRRELTAAYPVCGVSGCANDRFLEIDHVVPVCDGGETSKGNCWRICPHHHFLKHRRGWRITCDPGRWDLVPP
jgi:uncharacterized protein DUF222